MNYLYFEKIFNQICLFLIVSSFLYGFFLLASNVGRGLDITDESYYLISSMFPEKITMSVSSFGIYTNLLLYLAGNNIALFQLYGIILLLISAGGFSWLLVQYVVEISKASFNTNTQLMVVFSLLTGSLAYYRFWLMTPSYNWLALLSTVIVASGLILLVLKKISWVYKQQISYLLVATGGFLAFMAKPTTAAILSVVTILWMLVHHKIVNIWRMVFVVSSFIIVLFTVHIIFFENGVIEYIDKIKNGLELAETLGGYGVGTIVNKVYDQFVYLLFNLYSVNIVTILSAVTFLFIVIKIINRKTFDTENFGRSSYHLLVVIVTIYTSFLLSQVFSAELHSSAGSYIWLYGLKVLGLLFTLSTVIYVVLHNERIVERQLHYFKLAFFILFLLFCSFSYSFGTANVLLKAMSGSFIFMLAAIVSVALILDDYFNRKILVGVLGVLLSIFVLNILNNAYEQPYRLESPISEQTIPVKLLSGETLKVDRVSAQYINTLQGSALREGWVQRTPLIDMTGGAPGANVILNAGFLGVPWLIGGYNGSSDFVLNVLNSSKKSDLKKAWILLAPQGKRSIPVDVLKKVGINYPENYKFVSALKTNHRHEHQELWAPL